MRISKDLLFSGTSALPLHLQSEASECGLACLAMIASYHGHETDLTELRKRFPISLKGVTLEQLIEMAEQLGFSSRPLRLELDEVKHLRLPCILHWDLSHFVVLKSIRRDIVTILDPAFGEVKFPLQAISGHFSGIALELAPNLDFRRKSAPVGIELRHLIGKVSGLKRGLLQLLILAAVLEVVSLLTPMLNQWITDEAIVSGERELLGTLCISIVLLGISHAGVSALRTWIGLYISTSFSMQWMSNVMGHLLRLPIDYFERRHLGDVVNRFGSVRAIETMLTTAMVDVLLDGVLAISTLIMMFVYNPALAAVTLGVVVLYSLLRWLRYNAVRVANQGLIVKQALEQSYFLETIRGIRSIKLFNREHERKSSWLNRMVAVTNANLMMQKLDLNFSTSWSCLSAVERGLIFWLGAIAVIDGRMTLGMLFAFLSYKEQFTSRINTLINRFVDFKMLGIQSERLADIVLTQPEERLGTPTQDIPDDLTLSFDRVSFRYGSGDGNILNNISLSIKPGECIAIVGASGGGKTTMMKLMLSILKPTTGKVMLGGIPLAKLGLRQYRYIIATVMQDDQLYAGSIYDNICFFDTKPDKNWLETCARYAGIHDEIVAMPMAYHSLVGDMGTVLSGGQKQRVLVARALYKRPRILFLDEATSHLDTKNEELMNKAIASLAITRIIIAHRPQTIAIADRVLRIEGGRLKEESIVKATSQPLISRDTQQTALPS